MRRKKIYAVKRNGIVEQKEPDQAAVNKHKTIIVGSEKTKKTTSAGRTFELPIWYEC